MFNSTRIKPLRCGREVNSIDVTVHWVQEVTDSFLPWVDEVQHNGCSKALKTREFIVEWVLFKTRTEPRPDCRDHYLRTFILRCNNDEAHKTSQILKNT